MYWIDVHHSGRVVQRMTGSLLVSCALNMWAYPYDTHTCNLLFSHFRYLHTEVHYTGITAALAPDSVYVPNTEFEVSEIKGEISGVSATELFR